MAFVAVGTIRPHILSGGVTPLAVDQGIVPADLGRIEDITLTYVVIHVWDDRRLIVPTSYLMSVPFENWTRKESALLGTPEEIVARLRKLEGGGVDYVLLVDPTGSKEALRTFAEEIMPHFPDAPTL